MTAPRMYVRACGQGHELVAIVTPETLHKRAHLCIDKHAALAETIRRTAVDAPLGRFDRLRASARILSQFAWVLRDKADALRVALSREIAAPVKVECPQCGSEVYAADLEPQDDDEDICRACHANNVEEGNRLLASDWNDYNHDRGV